MAELEPDRTFREMEEVLQLGVLAVSAYLKDVLPKVVEYWDILSIRSRKALVNQPWSDSSFGSQPFKNKLKILEQYINEQEGV